MKKLIFAAVAVLVMASFITSCTKESSKCFHVKYTVPAQAAQYNSDSTEITREAQDAYNVDAYKWMTESEKTACQSTWESMKYTDITIEAADSYKTKIACLSAGK